RPAHPSVLFGLAGYQRRAPVRPKPPVIMAITQIRASTTATMKSQGTVKPIPKATIARIAKRTSSSIDVPSFPPGVGSRSVFREGQRGSRGSGYARKVTGGGSDRQAGDRDGGVFGDRACDGARSRCGRRARRGGSA